MSARRAVVTVTVLLLGCVQDPKSQDTAPPVGDSDVDTAGETAADTHVDSQTDTSGDTGTAPAHVDPWTRSETLAPGSVTFNEIAYHPPGSEDLEWLELHNPMAIDVDLSGWSLAGGVTWSFPEGTLLAAGGYLVVAADPALTAGALGPYTGRLSNGGDTLELHNNQGRLIDTVSYDDDEPWPVQPDGSGVTLAKSDPDAASDHAESWSPSQQLGGTPGQANLLDPDAPPTTLELVPLDATWSYDVSGDYPAPDWSDPAYDDSAWARGDAIFYAGAAVADEDASAWATADNYFAMYLGNADGTDLRLIGQDLDDSWTTVESFDTTVTPDDHLYLAAWELPGDSYSPQMAIAEVQLPSGDIGTNAATFEWVLGPTDVNPGALPPGTPPTEDEIFAVVDDANTAAAWALPAVEASRTSSPWGSTVGGSFDDEASFVWADTFDSASITNTDNTYVLLRSQDPLLGPRGTTELPTVPVTTTFRTTFTLDGDPASAELSLDALVDDGAVFYLNGVEVLRTNMPSGTVTADTLASTEIVDPSDVYADLPTASLVRGENVLTVEVHQASRGDLDLTFGCSLTARFTAETALPTLLLNEVAPSTATPFGVELLDASSGAQATTGLVLTSSSGGELVLPAGKLKPGGLLAIEDVGFDVAAGDVLSLYSADRTSLLDAVRVQDRRRARAADGGPWRYPQAASLGEPNVIDTADDIVINEIQYHHAPVSVEGTPVTSVPEEWIELYNRGTDPVDLGGWQLVDATAFEFPAGTVLAPDAYLVVASDAAALRKEHPDIDVLGDLSGQLNNNSDRILLLDAHGNPADEVRYFDGGRWPGAADGGGSSLELRDPRADNEAPEAWAASDESGRSTWETYTYRGVASASAVGPDGVWNELVLGLLDAGEVLIDDVSVVQDPDGARTELVQNGSFDAGSDHWRLLGNHRHSAIVPDPDDPGNPVLDLVATGATEHMHNHAESTLLAPIGVQPYEVSFRARWVSGSNQLHSRLYFSRLPHTTLVTQPSGSGTPGAPNSTRVDNAGPTFADLHQDVAVPAAGQTVLVTVSVADPDGVASVTLRSRVDGGTFGDTPMTEVEPGQWQGRLAGQSAGTIVQMYVEAQDDLGATATFPAAGPDSRALVKFDDGLAATNGLHNFRILMTDADSDWLLDDINVMSDDAVGGTVVYDESQVYYDIGIRTKGSERGRPEVARLGYGVSFHSEQPFRGSHSTALVDRSEGVGTGQREVLMNLVMTHAGSVSGEYNDLIQALTPRLEHTGPAELQLDRFSDLVLDSQFTDGSSGPLYKYELIYFPLTTDDGTPEGYKLPQPDSVIGTSLTDLGDDKEAYRWNFLLQNNEREDDFTRLIEMNQTFAERDAAFLADAPTVIDVDEWLRAFAFATLSGAVDNYGGDGSQHNAQLYVRPEDQLVLYFPHDLDYYGGSTMPVVNNRDLARLLEDPDNRRAYYGHLQDIIARAYNGPYMAHWCSQIGALLPAQDFAGHCQFMVQRAAWIMDGASDAVDVVYPPVSFGITTGGGADFSVTGESVTLEGDGWVDVRQILLDGDSTPLDVTWLDGTTWQVTVPLLAGPNPLTLTATDLRGAVVGTDSIVVTSE